MSFVPEKEAHALVEVVFGLQFDRPWTPKEIQQIKAAHVGDEEWVSFLPSINDVQLHEMVLGPNGFVQPHAVPVTGVVFERIQPDGTIAWRLACDQSAIYINCLDYTRWAEIWPKVANLIVKVLTASNSENLHAVGVFHQTIDLFKWSGDTSDYDVTRLLDSQSDSVPARVANNGLMWHLYQGWFQELIDPLPGKLLTRVHFDAPAVPVGVVKMDTHLGITLKYPLPVRTLLGADSAVQQLFVLLHRRNKDVLKDFLTDEALISIDLK